MLLLVYSSKESCEIGQNAGVDEKEGTLHVLLTFLVGALLAIPPHLWLDPSGSHLAHIESPRALAEEDCEIQAFCSQAIGATELRKVLPFWRQR